MRILILLASFIYALCLTKSYYKKCLAGTDYIDILSANECREYDPEGGYCCFLDYDNDKIPVFLFFKKKKIELTLVLYKNRRDIVMESRLKDIIILMMLLKN